MDERFSKVHTDPRFRKPKKDANKIALDERFSGMLKSKEFGSKAKVDKYGRKQESSVPKDLKRFYKLEEDEESSGDEPRLDLARGEGLEESSEEESELEEEEIEVDEGIWADEEIPTGDETHRFAVVNLDWDHVKAKDLYKIYDGFKPTKGYIKKVTIYPSEFGKERMAQEAVQGPPSSVFVPKGKEGRKVKDDEGKDFNMAALRKYQMERLRYYYAVCECDSVDTARAIVKACDGSEFESSGNFFDLRYIPNDMEFEDEPHDEATEPPAAYEPVEFVTQALQHSNVKLTWDAEDPERTRTTKRKFTKDEIKKMDFDAYLASDSEDEVDEDLKNKYKALLGDDDEQDEGEEMEITFAPGLSEKAAKRLEEIKEEKERANETVFEANLRKQREKKKAKKAAQNQEESESERDDLDDPFFQHDFGSDFDEPKVEKKSKKAEKKKMDKQERLEKAKSRAELELLMMNEDNKVAGDHFSAKDVIKAEKSKNKKQKKKQLKKLANLETQDDFQMDLSDPRFSSLITNHEFFIDPTKSNFKMTKTMKDILSKKREANAHAEPTNENSVDQKSKEKIELSHLVDSVKRKSSNMTKGQGKRTKLA
ncbi:pre-rRNA-processing protein esf1 [Boothiomyces sp. JEL0838]|nr:pre-rRNA-processing protein esf1 [Boothiomyces sp. JEL0838]